METRMERTKIGAAVTVSLIMAFWATSAVANDLTGTWTGNEKCQCVDATDGKFTERYTDQVMEVTQDGTDLNILVFDELFNGNVIANPTQPRRATAAIIACSTDPNNNASFGETGQAKIRMRKNGASKMRVESFWNVSETRLCSCTSTLTQTNTEDPKIGDCGS